MDWKDKKNVKFGKETRGHPQKACECCKAFERCANFASNMHNTSESRSKEYHRKKFAGSNNEDEPVKKSYKKNCMSNYLIKEVLKNKLGKLLQGMMPGTSDSDSDYVMSTTKYCSN